MDEFKEGWKPLMACVLGTACGILAVTFYTQGLFVGPVTEDFGWTHGQFFNGFTILMVTGLITAPVAGSFVDSWGPRTVGMLGLTGHAVIYFLISFNPGSLILWYVSFFLLAVFAAGSLPITWTSVINGWFSRRRGLAIGLAMGGSGLMALIAPPIVERLIEGLDWRWAYRLLGTGALIASLPVAFFWLKTREGTHSSDSVTQPEGWGLTRSEAINTYKFWALGGALMLMALAVGGLIPNFVPILVENGISRLEAAGLASIMGITIIAGRLSVGYLVDRFWAPGVSAIIFLMPIGAIVMLATIPVTPMIAIISAITLGLAAGAALDLLAYLTGRYFGTRYYGSVFGAIFAFFTVASGLAPNLYGRSYDIVGTYAPILWVSAGILLVSITLFLSLGPYPEEVRIHAGSVT